ncbi:Aste57867_19124 [Aphanomyces stellatus]|uniref:Aste57867_19124 protein n=1 Tax=Aphanomyces stellatus TaxID=120398 RepID=A0A485LC16_9STRA|nr:hypothetical protein As57867_019060 [Aphanomyces stellatus]VFT95847.1 Aste57867_19124 [Aphanomyces stellatus]
MHISISVALAGLLALTAVYFGEEDLPHHSLLEAKYASTALDLESLAVPVLTGAPLRIFASITGLPLVGPLLLKVIRRDNRFVRVRELAATLDDPPMYYPLHYPQGAEYTRHLNRTNDLTPPNPPKSSVRGNYETDLFKRHGIRDYTDAYKSGQVTPLQVAHAVLAAIDASNAAEIPLRAVIASNKDAILKEATASTARYAAGTPSGPLDGVPVLIKDETDVQGYETHRGTSFLGKMDGKATKDALPVARLRQAGALIMGKTNMHELGTGAFGLNLVHGAARNAYSSHHMAGGSSGGSAAAVGAGLVPLALGVDGGGSTRIPASFNGVVGIKATFMRVPEVMGGAPSFAHTGPIATTVEDAALAYAIISGQDPSVPMSSIQPPPHVDLKAMDSMDLRHLRVGVFHEYVAGADPEIVAQYYAHLNHLESLGAILVNVTIPNLQTIHLAQNIGILSEISRSVDKHSDQFLAVSSDAQVALRLARLAMSSLDVVAAQVVRSYATRLIRDLFQSVDVFLTPTTPITAPMIQPEYLTDGLSDLGMTVQVMRFCILGNLVGFPSMAVPMGYASSNVPTSMMVQAAHWNEDVMLHVARVIEKHAPSPRQPTASGYFYDILKMAQHDHYLHDPIESVVPWSRNVCVATVHARTPSCTNDRYFKP